MTSIPNHPTPTIGPVQAFNIIKDFEEFGGSEAYVEHLKNNPEPSDAKALVKPLSIQPGYEVACDFAFGSLVAYSWGMVKTVDGHWVKLQGWGFAISSGVGRGKLTCTSKEELFNGELDFLVGPGDIPLISVRIIFSRNNNWVGEVNGVIFGGAGPNVFSGKCTWS